MGFDLKPANKEVEPITIGAFTWPAILDSGVGLCIGAGSGGPGKWFYCGDQGIPPYTNDGFKVSAEDAAIMARCAEVALQRGMATDEYSPDSPLVRSFKRFIPFAKASHGFEVW